MPGLLFQVSLPRFKEEVKLWGQGKVKVNYLESQNDYFFYLTTANEDYCCRVPKDELSPTDKQSLLHEGKRILARIKDDTAKVIRETVTDAVTNATERINPESIKDTVAQALEQERQKKKTEEVLQNLINDSGKTQ